MVTWILVADSSFMEIFSLKGLEISKVQKIDNPDGRLRSGEILTDRPGRAFEGKSRTGAGSRRSAYGTEVDPHEHEQQIFAHKIVEALRHGKEARAFEKLIVIAPPHFLGELRRFIPEGIRACVTKEINKEIPSALSENERISWLRKFLELKRPKVPTM